MGLRVCPPFAGVSEKLPDTPVGARETRPLRASSLLRTVEIERRRCDLAVVRNTVLVLLDELIRARRPIAAV